MPRDFPNTQWKYVLVDAEDGSVHGTASDDVAKEWARSETAYVIDVARCVVILPADSDGEEFTAENIPEQTLFQF